MSKKLLFSLFALMLLLGFHLSATNAYASEPSMQNTDEASRVLSHFEAELRAQKSEAGLQALSYMREALGARQLANLLKGYQKMTGDTEKAYTAFETILKSTYSEVKANGFSPEQAKALLISAANLETGSSTGTPMTYYDNPPFPDPNPGAAVSGVKKQELSSALLLPANAALLTMQPAYVAPYLLMSGALLTH